MSATKDIAVLVPGRMLDYASKRVENEFQAVKLPSGDPSLVTPEMADNVRGIGAMTRITADFIDALPKLEIIANFGVGYDAVDAPHAVNKGILVTNTPDVLTEEVADTTIGLLLNTVREFPRAEKWLREGRWAREGGYPLTHTTLRERSVGIFGMGRIGQAVARRLEAFGVTIAYHNRRPVEGSPYTYHSTLLGLAEAVDTLISVAPGGQSTDKAVNAAVLKALGPDGVFINIGRGSTVDEDALITALQDGTIRAAGLDVFAHEPKVPEALIKLENTCLLPHVGSASQHTRQAMGDLMVENLISWFANGTVITPVPEAKDLALRLLKERK
ncbi:MAG TPA: 2-hydroxyacid dehydrogenase [Rhizobiaceae bacterium]|nr:2-hydroxyacid dehydrogenase [Rhizobiaceae bacterium]